MLSKGSVRKPYTVLVSVIMILVLGVVSFTRMTTDLLPSINLPYVIVMTTYIGASPETVEMVVTQPLEASMTTVSNIEGVSSVSAENYSMLILEFAQTADMDSVSLEIRENIDQIKSYWTDDAISSPIIMKLNPDMMPIMVAAIGVEGMNRAEVSELATNEILPELESLEGVASATASGLLEEKVHVIIREDKIAELNKKIFASIDDELREAEEEIEEAKSELASGWTEINDGFAELNSSLTDLYEARLEVLDGLIEVADGKVELEDGKNELSTTKEETIEELGNAYAQLIDAKTEIVANKAVLNSQLMTIDAQLSDNNLSVAEIITYNTINTQIDTLQNDNSINWTDSNWDNMPAKESSIKSNSTVLYAYKDSLSDLESASPNDINTKLSTTKTLNETILNSLTSAGLSVDTIITLVNTTSTLETQEAEIDTAIAEITKAQLEASTGFSVGEAQIALGEVQLDSAQSQLESAEEQINSGIDQIDSARDQLKDAEEQLRDAEEQLADGEEQLKEAKENAYESADMVGILTVDTVKGLLTAQNFSMPAGYVTEEGIDYLVRIGDKPEDVESLQNMPLINMNMDYIGQILLSDVADVFMTDNDDEIYTNINGSNGVMITIQKQTGYSTGDVSDKINDKFKELMNNDSMLSIVTLNDQGVYIDLVMGAILDNVFYGAILAVLVLILFLRDLRPTFIIACSIPISLITAVVCMYFSGITLNVISLSGLALGIGMLVDNSIVVIENIYRLRNEGYSKIEAAIAGSKEVAGAIMASTLTTVCVFLPIVFVEGITRQLFVDMGLTIAYSLFASLLIALTVVPAMASKMLNKVKESKQEEKSSKLNELVMDTYEKILVIALRFKYIFLVVALIFLGISISLALSNGTAFMTDMDSNQFTINLTMEKGTPLEVTSVVTDEIVEGLLEIPDIKDVGATMSGDSASLMGMGGGSSTDAMTLYLTTADDKKSTNEELAKEIEEKFAYLEDVELDIQTSSMDMSAMTGSGITIQVRGRELDTLREIASDVGKILEQVEGTANVNDGLEETTEELRIEIDRVKAMEHNTTVAQIFTQIAPKLATPSTATVLTTAIKDYDIYVMNQSDITLTREEVKRLTIDVQDKDGKKQTIPLTDVATFITAEGLTSINRSDQTRYIQISAGIAEGYNIGLVSPEVEKALAKYDVPTGYQLVSSGEDEMIMEAMEQMFLMLALAIIFMYLIMVAQFQSLLSPFIIMFTIPLAFTGGFLGLFVSGSEVSVIAMIGFVMLSGIIVNNGIVLVDYMNQLREEGRSKKDALIEAGRTRIRPVFMTALTTILALSTMVFSQDMGSDMAKPMAIVTIGGLVYGTILTLLIIPCIYDILVREKKETDEFEQIIES
ncbi:MAG: efflux RND transporter permease subunit [Eubacteriales bacterium]